MAGAGADAAVRESVCHLARAGPALTLKQSRKGKIQVPLDVRSA